MALGRDGCAKADMYSDAHRVAEGLRRKHGELKREFGALNKHVSNRESKRRTVDRELYGAAARRQDSPLLEQLPPDTADLMHWILIQRSSAGLFYSKAGGIFDLSAREEMYRRLVQHIDSMMHAGPDVAAYKSVVEVTPVYKVKSAPG